MITRIRINGAPSPSVKPARPKAFELSARPPQSPSRSFPLGPASALKDVDGALDGLLTGLLSRGSFSHARGALDLDTSSYQRASTLTSTAQLNPAESSYDKVQLTLGGSTALANLSGVYAGSGAASGATSLKLEITANGTVGTDSSPLQFRILDQTNTTLFSYSGTAKAGESISLGADIGLSVSFSEGTTVSGGAGLTTVKKAVATTVNPQATFDDADVNSRPRFASGAQVSAGRFFVDGVQIDVHADDSVTSVLQRINETVSDVRASIDNDRITLSTRSNSGREIVLANDTSGFLAATKLAEAVTVRGHVRGDQQRLDESSAFAAVTKGSFRVNGQLVSIDPASDTLASILTRINEADSSVSARYDSAGKGVELSGPELVLDDDSSGFLVAAGLYPGAQPVADEPALSFSANADRMRQSLHGSINDLLGDLPKVSQAGAKKAAGLSLPAGRAQAAYRRWVPSPARSPTAPKATPRSSST